MHRLSVGARRDVSVTIEINYILGHDFNADGVCNVVAIRVLRILFRLVRGSGLKVTEAKSVFEESTCFRRFHQNRCEPAGPTSCQFEDVTKTTMNSQSRH